MEYDVLIVGAGHGGAQAAISLRQNKYEGSIAMIGDEPDLPYERPPLSKEYFAGQKTFESILIRPKKFWKDQRISMLMDRLVTTVNPNSKFVTTNTGETISYGKLIWAAGGKPRRLSLPGSNLAGIHGIRTRGDTDSILAEFEQVNEVVIVGGGYIGLEAAAVIRKLGKKVVLLEALDRVLARVAGESLSRFYESEHRAHGVEVRLSQKISEFVGEKGKVVGVKLNDGEIISAQMIIVGIGIIPSVEPLVNAGALGDNGVEVDEYCQTSLKDIYAIGDCAAHRNIFADGEVIRLESVQNANDQAKTVAKAIVGKAEPYEIIPWFWSNQYDVKLQTVGLHKGYDDIVIRGQIESHSFSLIYLKKGRVIALDCVNAIKDFAQGRAMVMRGLSPEKEKLSDPEVLLKDIIMSMN